MAPIRLGPSVEGDLLPVVSGIGRITRKVTLHRFFIFR